MATLNIKNSPEKEEKAKEKEKPYILELRGLGKEAWNGVDAVEHINQERESWE